MDLGKTSKFALYSIKRLVFITEVECVYCAVRTEPLYVGDSISKLQIQVAS
jgi:hypothetical protein